MNKKALIFIVIALIFIFFIWDFGDFIKFYWPGQKEKAVDVAQTYLKKEFKQQMNYLDIWAPYEPMDYMVYFSPKNNIDLKFCVVVLPNLSVSSNDYYIKFFELEMARVYKENVKEIWGNQASIYAFINLEPIQLMNSIPNLNEQTKLEDIKPNLREYYFAVKTKKIFEPEEKLLEAERIYKMINFTKETGYKPGEILFWYLNPEQDKKERYISIRNWNEITSVEQVVEFLDANSLKLNK